jgi:sigma-E factor negative regulatory protein RseA
MKEQIREQMSALLDGELAASEVGLLVRRMERDDELKRAFSSYVLAGEALRSPGGVLASAGFAARVSAAIDSGAPLPAAQPAPERGSLRWKRPLVATAVAASAALAAVLLVRPEGEDTRLFAERAAAPAQTSISALPVGGSSPTPAQSQRLAGYLVTHGQYATPLGRRNVWSSALATDPGIARVTYETVETP